MARKAKSARTSRPAKRPGGSAVRTVKVDHVHDAIAKRLWQAAEGQYNIRGIAGATGFNHESIRRWFNGLNAVSIAFIDPFCRATGVSIEWLVTGRGSMKPKK